MQCLVFCSGNEDEGKYHSDDTDCGSQEENSTHFQIIDKHWKRLKLIKLLETFSRCKKKFPNKTSAHLHLRKHHQSS